MTRRPAAAAAVGIWLLGLPAAGLAQQSATSGREAPDTTQLELAGRAAAEELGVTFLAVRAIEHQGRTLASVRVMEPGGNSNAAFLVQTLIVEPATGEVIGVFPGRDAPMSVVSEPVERAGRRPGLTARDGDG